jgi:hypothetical protein
MPATGKIISVLLLSMLVSIFSGCGRNPVNRNGSGSQPPPGRPSRPHTTRITRPGNDQMFAVGDPVIVQVDKVADTVQNIDSVEFFFGGSKVHACLKEPYSYAFNTGNLAVGTLAIRTVTWLADSLRE